MTVATEARGWSPGKLAVTAVLAIIALLAVIAAVMYFTEPAKSLPSILGAVTHPASRANAHRSLRGGVALAVGVVGLGAAWFASRRGRPSAQ